MNEATVQIAPIPDTDHVIHLRDVDKLYNIGMPDEVRILDNIDLSVRRGEFLSVVGPSGCGKSTLLKMVIGQVEHTSGDVLINGEAAGKPDARRGVVYQNYSLAPHLNALDNVTLGKRLSTTPWGWFANKKQYYQEGMSHLERVGLADHAHKYPKELSGGQRQRVAIAQALIQDHSILCMDEPFSALDTGTQESLQMFLLELWEETSMTILFVTHDLHEAVFLGTRCIALSQYWEGETDGITITGKEQGARIVIDRKVGEIGQAFSPSIKGDTQFASMVDDIKAKAFSPEYRQLLSRFQLEHPDSWRTL